MYGNIRPHFSGSFALREGDASGTLELPGLWGLKYYKKKNSCMQAIKRMKVKELVSILFLLAVTGCISKV